MTLTQLFPEQRPITYKFWDLVLKNRAENRNAENLYLTPLNELKKLPESLNCLIMDYVCQLNLGETQFICPKVEELFAKEGNPVVDDEGEATYTKRALFEYILRVIFKRLRDRGEDVDLLETEFSCKVLYTALLREDVDWLFWQNWTT